MVYPMRRITTGKQNTMVWKQSDIKRLKELEDENRRLKATFAELSLEHRILKDIVEKAVK
jgi:hypothetical protein